MIKSTTLAYLLFLSTCLTFSVSLADRDTNVMFIHPDGTGMAGWAAMRMLEHGPDGYSNWDKLERMALYRGHQRDSLATSSHAGATAHAYGKRVPTDSFGMFGTQPLTALSGYDGSILQEAKSKGLFVGVINSGHLCEPGTAVYAASSPSRKNTDLIAKRVIESQFDVIFSGGEIMLLPEGVMGKHGRKGVRKDGLNLIKMAKLKGYTVIYTREELKELKIEKGMKVLGVFAAEDTYNDVTEEDLRKAGLPSYEPDAPTVSEMLEVALQIATASKRQFCLVLEEEGTDNFGNKNNASGSMDAYLRADKAIGVALDYINAHPNTLLLTAADSDASSPAVISPGRDESDYFIPGKPLPAQLSNGAPLDGKDGTGTPPFISHPDQFGETHTFGISWASPDDVAGGVIARAHGAQSELFPLHIENTGIYRFMYKVLFGIELRPE